MFDAGEFEELERELDRWIAAEPLAWGTNEARAAAPRPDATAGALAGATRSAGRAGREKRGPIDTPTDG